MIFQDTDSTSPKKESRIYDACQLAVEIIKDLKLEDLDSISIDSSAFKDIHRAVKLLNPDFRILTHRNLPVFEFQIPVHLKLPRLTCSQHHFSGGRARNTLAEVLNIELAFDRVRDEDVICIGVHSPQQNFDVARKIMSDEVAIVTKQFTSKTKFKDLDEIKARKLLRSKISNIIRYFCDEYEYFCKRDLTINEVFCNSNTLQATPRAIVDNLIGRIRPCNSAKANEEAVFVKALRFAAEADCLDFEHELIQISYPLSACRGKIKHFLWVHLKRVYNAETRRGYDIGKEFLDLCISKIPDINLSYYPDTALRILEPRSSSNIWLNQLSIQKHKPTTPTNFRARLESLVFDNPDLDFENEVIQTGQDFLRFKIIKKVNEKQPDNLSDLRFKIASTDYNPNHPFAFSAGEISVYKFTSDRNIISLKALRFANQVASIHQATPSSILHKRKSSVMSLACRYVAKTLTDKNDNNNRIAIIVQHIENAEDLTSYIKQFPELINFISHFMLDIVKTVRALQAQGIFLCKYNPENMLIQQVKRRKVIRLYDTEKVLLPNLAFKQARVRPGEATPRFALSVLKDRLSCNKEISFELGDMLKIRTLDNWIKASKAQDMSALYYGLANLIMLFKGEFDAPLTKAWGEIADFFVQISHSILNIYAKKTLSPNQQDIFTAQISIDKLNIFICNLFAICSISKKTDLDKFNEIFKQFREELKIIEQ
ncbi:MAG: hypothetical protein KDD56_05275 [Bdellovibrionales bacterium]|nr:hypothetical protein [Bdellovibrionales bacterium]